MRFLVFFTKHETRWASQKQAEKILTIFWMAKLVFFAINSDDFWFGMKG